jgi:hypothetical protein
VVVSGEVKSWPEMGVSTTVGMFWKTLPSAKTLPPVPISKAWPELLYQ